MDLLGLINRCKYETDNELADVLVMDPKGRRFEVLSLNWDPDNNVWLIVCDNE